MGKKTPLLLIMLLDYYNIWIPRFCYHKKLSSSGNCRMCLVEVKGSVKPLISCCILFNTNMIVYTNTELIRKSREYIMEFLLINHPLDCPICDQAGECDLQDLSLIYGSDESRFKYKKKAILNKKVGALIKTNMNRCIYCTRCVRYTSELNNVYTFNTLGRGGYSEISNYFQPEYESNYIDGNVIDLCPVGALTSKPYLFRNRTWELVSIESIDILDSLCSNIRIDTINNVVARILPKPNPNLNEEWITDKIRFCYDGFKKQRLSYPTYNNRLTLSKINSNVITKVPILSSWFLVFSKVELYYNLYYSLFHKNTFFSVFTGNLTDVFSTYTLKSLSLISGINQLNIESNFNMDLRKYYLFNNSIKSMEINNVFLIVGTNLKVDSPILNLKLRTLKYKYNKKINICYIGQKVTLNYPLIHLGMTMNTLINLFLGKSFYCKLLNIYSNIVCFFSILFNKNYTFFNFIDKLSSLLWGKNFIVNYLTLFTSDISLYELGMISHYYVKSDSVKRNPLKMCFFLGVDFEKMRVPLNTINIYQGHHGNIGFKQSDITLPGNTFIENTSYFINCEGRLFSSNTAIKKKKKILFNETILFNLFSLFNTNKKSLKQIFVLFFHRVPFFFTKYKYMLKLFFISSVDKSFYIKNRNFSINRNFYKGDIISQSSYNVLKLMHTNSLNWID